ncbi:formyl transferase [Nodosilinea sp. LEGE 07088]|uniref:formyltransferase family protein n=1 Tax=Nodosilinea sp. LEGE 07088 TaxID=2777968 RepID=UPI00187F8C89|nr:formyltransferase family protein [Nodosilinea sp. LEGE 07088]MBE9138809.1 formyl transferase [Nodosilinea sp. LEGE 07088]
MNILYLGNNNSKVVEILARYGDCVISTSEKLTGNDALVKGADFLVSYGYRHILKTDILNQFDKRAINIHISLLPWNRGADPNLWSFLEDTPKGVTLHFLDAGVDTGDIILQEEIFLDETETLSTSYNKLSELALSLLDRNWAKIRAGEINPFKQPPGGSFHRLADRKNYEYLLTQGWNTPAKNLTGKAI